MGRGPTRTVWLSALLIGFWSFAVEATPSVYGHCNSAQASTIEEIDAWLEGDEEPETVHSASEAIAAGPDDGGCPGQRP